MSDVADKFSRVMGTFIRVLPDHASAPEKWQWRVEREPHGLAVIAEERVSAYNSEGRVLEQACFWMSEEELAWLHDSVGDLLEVIREEKKRRNGG